MEQDIIIYNTFSNMKRITKFPEIDLLIWTVSLLNYKKLGYKLKIFCEESDVEVLKELKLYDLYDEIDTKLFTNNDLFKKVNEEQFWSTRKIEAINYQLQLNPNSIYSDTDIIMTQTIDVGDCDAVVWGAETRAAMGSNGVYIDWSYLTYPEDYYMPAYLIRTHDAVNCGLMWFRDYKVFKEYREEYYKFVIGNPCEIHIPGKYAYGAECYACNAEQRILKGVLEHKKLKVGVVDNPDGTGVTDKGVHFYKLRAAWRGLAHIDENVQEEKDRKFDLLVSLNHMVARLIYETTFAPEIFEYWDQKEWFNTFADKRDEDPNGIALKEYF